MSKSKVNADFMAALPTFINEAQEQTDAMESLLLELEEAPQDSELLKSLFRCAHTVKGSAGLFGLDQVVEFTHHVETLLDLMREGKLAFSSAVGTLLLQCNDQIRYLVELGFSDTDTQEQQILRVSLVNQLRALTHPGAASPSAPSAAASAAEMPSAVPATLWSISAKFGLETFRNGMDPLAIVRFLTSLGVVADMRCDTSAVPAVDDMVFDSCYLSFVMELQTEVDRDELVGAFDFVQEDCTFAVEAIESADQRMLRSLEDMPDTPRLGEMLLAVGAVSKDQLARVLDAQVAGGGASAQDTKPMLGTLLVEQAGVSAQLVSAALGKQQKIREKNSGEEGRYIRVQADRLDTVINLLGELVISGAGAGAALQIFQDRNVCDATAVEALVETLVEGNRNMNRLIEEIRNNTLGLRMVPVGETFSRFKRVVRDTASSLGKQVQFDVVGGEAELDKSMVEKIADPLMHLVRNSLDHGLETPAEREQAGKPAMGHLTLSAKHETGAILIRIEDDGRGINREKVLQKAWSKGLVEQGVIPSDSVIDMLIFEPGFSTADQVTNLSGRGVGMDVVRSNIESLRGTLKLVSDPGKGLTVDIRLPLTLAIIDGFLVGVGESKFVLPLETVLEVIEADAQYVKVDVYGRHCVELRGAVLPVVRLKSLYAIESEQPSRVSIVVVNSARGQYGIEVEQLLGQNQIVIKPLGCLFKTLRGISGSAILGSGEVALIIDAASLCQLTTERPMSELQQSTRVGRSGQMNQTIKEGEQA